MQTKLLEEHEEIQGKIQSSYLPYEQMCTHKSKHS